MLSLKKIQRKQ